MAASRFTGHYWGSCALQGSLWDVVRTWLGAGAWQSDEAIEHTVRLEIQRQRDRMRSAVGGQVPSVPRLGSVKLFALSMHPGLLQEPLLWWRDILQSASDGELAVVSPAGGGGRLCASEGGPACGSRDRVFGELLAKHVSKHSPLQASFYWQDMVSNLSAMRDDVVELYQSAMGTADILFCGEPLAFCFFYASAAKPVVAYIGNTPLFYAAPEDFQLVLQGAYDLMASSASAFLCISPTISTFVEQHVGLPMLALAPQALHVGAAMYGYTRSECRSGSADDTAKVLLSKRITDTFNDHCMITLLLAAAKADHLPTDFLNVRVIAMADLSAEESTFEAWARFRAAILNPMDWLQMVVYDWYALSLPIFVPDAVRRLPTHLFMKYRGRAFDYDDSALAPVRPGHDFVLGQPQPFPFLLPFSDKTTFDTAAETGLWDSLRAWSQLTDFVQLPHLIEFTSYAEVLLKLADLKFLEKTARAMAVFHRRQSVTAGIVWRSALCSALHATPRNAPSD
eukprot:TRINITY_DN24350_c0_g1_i5.p1 TRINITY_DN24350_c0_g1~~TRINITY_DN24350_c0_g1_i5.p1  ORF type:complete len:510 (-),score=76.68 TRINITY_DN24350_c0_g1_i5:198-1727(-)